MLPPLHFSLNSRNSSKTSPVKCLIFPPVGLRGGEPQLYENRRVKQNNIIVFSPMQSTTLLTAALLLGIEPQVRGVDDSFGKLHTQALPLLELQRVQEFLLGDLLQLLQDLF